jgi:hypothetical protein
MDKIKLIKSSLEKEKKTILNTIKKEKEIRDTSSSAMQSWSDTTRSQAEDLIFALEEKVKKIDELLKSLPENSKPSKNIELWSYIEFTLGEIKMKAIIVPEGIGGKEVEGVKLISENTPLGSNLIGKKVEGKFTFNNIKTKIDTIK